MTNEYVLSGGEAHITLDRGQVTRIDIADLPVVAKHSWYAKWEPTSSGFYARAIGSARGLLMQRLVARTPEGMQTDHINHDTLDNRRANLRIVTASQNGQNRRGAERRSTTGVRNVSIHRAKHKKYYVARVDPRGMKPIVRYFPLTQDGLALAREAAIALRRKFYPYSEDDRHEPSPDSYSTTTTDL